MGVVVHKYPGIDRAFPVDDVLAKPLKEQGLVLVVLEDIRLIDPAHHDMVQGAGDI